MPEQYFPSNTTCTECGHQFELVEHPDGRRVPANCTWIDQSVLCDACVFDVLRDGLRLRHGTPLIGPAAVPLLLAAYAKTWNKDHDVDGRKVMTEIEKELSQALAQGNREPTTGG